MKHISENLPPIGIPVSTPNLRPGPEDISSKWIDALFLRFSRIWPTAWPNIVASNGIDEIAQEWSEGLAGIDGEQIKRGIEESRKNCKWPPSIAEFRQLAMGAVDDWQQRGPAYRIHDPRRLLKAVPSDEAKDKAVVSFADMKRKLRG